MTTVAILGAGIGAEHLNAYRKLPQHFEVTRLIDKDVDRAESLRRSDRYVTSAEIEDALADASVDVIDICLPPHLHATIAIRALDAGKHVICEKPLATSMAEAARVELAASASGKNVYPVFQYRWGTPMAQLKALVASGLAGRPIIASLETHWSRDSDYYAVPWRGTWSGELGGAVLGHAIHSHDLLCFVMGPVDCLSAMTSTRVNPIETEDCAAISFRLQNGALATSSITLGAAGNETRLRFVFENLTATSGTAPYAPASQPWSFLARRADMQPSIDDALSNIPEQQVGFLGFLEEVARDMAGQPSSVVTLGEACASIELATAICHAARTGLRVSLPLSDQHPLHEGWLP